MYSKLSYNGKSFVLSKMKYGKINKIIDIIVPKM
jgi:hypothetical protein